MMTCTFGRTTSGRRTLSFNSPRGSTLHRKSPGFIPGSITSLAVSLLLVSSVFVMGCLLYHLYFFRNFIDGNLVSEELAGLSRTRDFGVCDVFDGSWVPDRSYPLYNSTMCPFAERGFNCLANGRKDTDYLRWRWKPRGCEVPRFDVKELLERLRGKRVVFVGDSMSRTQWESLICMLMTGVEDPKSVYEVNGNRISKTIRFLGVKFQTFNLSVEFFRSVFLIQQGSPPRHVPKRVRSILKLDKLDDINQRWIDSDVLIFNSGHWWTPVKLFDMGCYFQVGGSLRLGMPITTAFRTMVETWASWVETMIDTNRTRVFFRTFEPSHWSDEKWRICEVTQQPMTNASGNDQSEFSDIIADVVTKMSISVTVLNVTSMGAYRSDAHIGSWSDPPAVVDCSHWCLPGVPDAWNELVFSFLMTNAVYRQ